MHELETCVNLGDDQGSQVIDLNSELTISTVRLRVYDDVVQGESERAICGWYIARLVEGLCDLDLVSNDQAESGT